MVILKLFQIAQMDLINLLMPMAGFHIEARLITSIHVIPLNMLEPH